MSLDVSENAARQLEAGKEVKERDYSRRFITMLEAFRKQEGSKSLVSKVLYEQDDPDRGKLRMEGHVNPDSKEIPTLGGCLMSSEGYFNYDLKPRQRDLSAEYGADFADVIELSPESTIFQQGRLISFGGNIPMSQFDEISGQLDSSIAKAVAQVYDRNVVSTVVVEYDDNDIRKRLQASGYSERPRSPKIYDKLFGKPGNEKTKLPLQETHVDLSEVPKRVDLRATGLTSEVVFSKIRRLNRAKDHVGRLSFDQVRNGHATHMDLKFQEVASWGPGMPLPRVEAEMRDNTEGATSLSMSVELSQLDGEYRVKDHNARIPNGEIADLLPLPLHESVGNEAYRTYEAIVEAMASHVHKPVVDTLFIDALSNPAAVTILEARGYAADANASIQGLIAFRRTYNPVRMGRQPIVLVKGSYSSDI